MSPIFLYLLFAFGLLFFGLLPYLNLYTKKKKEKLFRNLSKEGAANNLVFCSQEILQNKVIGIDGIHRKIMILEKTKNKFNCSIISLDKVHDCLLVNHSGLLNTKNFKNWGSKITPATLELQFEFNDNSESASIVFGNSLINSKREFDLLRAKAEYWCIMFSKMLNRQVEAA